MTITVGWRKLRFTREMLDESDDIWKRCVYVIADSEGRPLYIGRATGAKYRGFGERYVGNSGPLSAIAHGSRNRLYLGRIQEKSDRDTYVRLERELIALESRDTGGRHPLYNRQHKSATPEGFRLKHRGSYPRFYHLQGGEVSSRVRTK